MPTAFSIGTITKSAKDPGRGFRVIQTTIGFSSDYRTGGEDLETELAKKDEAPGLSILQVKAEPVDSSHYFGYNPTTGKILAYVAGTGLEAADHADLSALSAVVVTVLAE